jgi:hypothetical protein
MCEPIVEMGTLPSSLLMKARRPSNVATRRNIGCPDCGGCDLRYLESGKRSLR